MYVQVSKNLWKVVPLTSEIKLLHVDTVKNLFLHTAFFQECIKGIVSSASVDLQSFYRHSKEL